MRLDQNRLPMSLILAVSMIVCGWIGSSATAQNQQQGIVKRVLQEALQEALQPAAAQPQQGTLQQQPVQRQQQQFQQRPAQQGTFQQQPGTFQQGQVQRPVPQGTFQRQQGTQQQGIIQGPLQQGTQQQQFQQGGRQQVYIPNPPAALNQNHLRDISSLVGQLNQYTKVLHDQHHAHLEGQRHAEKLDKDVTALERMAEGLQSTVTQFDGSPQLALRLRNDTNEFLQLSFRIARTIELTQPWLRGGQAQAGVDRMRQSARAVTEIAMQVDQYLPVDTAVIDGQTERLEAAIKELHDEFHEHLENYEVSKHLDEDLEDIETHVEHMHELAHNKSWAQIDLRHLQSDIQEVKQKTAHIESLFVRQAEIGVRSQDWIGIEHSRDAITDVLASAYLLEHMIRKTQPAQMNNRIPPIRNTQPMRDRHGHPVRDSGATDRHNDHLQTGRR